MRRAAVDSGCNPNRRPGALDLVVGVRVVDQRSWRPAGGTRESGGSGGSHRACPRGARPLDSYDRNRQSAGRWNLPSAGARDRPRPRRRLARPGDSGACPFRHLGVCGARAARNCSCVRIFAPSSRRNGACRLPSSIPALDYRPGTGEWINPQPGRPRPRVVAPDTIRAQPAASRLESGRRRRDGRDARARGPVWPAPGQGARSRLA